VNSVIWNPVGNAKRKPAGTVYTEFKPVALKRTRIVERKMAKQ
jgi:hypothetical protein